MKSQDTKVQRLRTLFCLLLFIFVYGEADAQMHLKANLQNMHLWRGMEVTDGLNAQNRYSTFAYAEYLVWHNELWNVKPGIGAAFALAPGKDENGASTSANFYGDTAGIVHISLATTYRLTAFKHDFPITVLALWNPQSNKGYLQIGIQLLSF